MLSLSNKEGKSTMNKRKIETFLKAKGIEVLRWGKTRVELAGGMIISRKKLASLMEKNR